jgi:ABC-type transport system involved in Fe-S cluster assembly fused permease/ATPase subunit
VVDRGTASMRVLLESMLFSVGPALIDVVAAAALLSSKAAWMALIVLVSVGFYVPVTIIITEYRGELRRQMNTLDNKKSAKARTPCVCDAFHLRAMPRAQACSACRWKG